MNKEQWNIMITCNLTSINCEIYDTYFGMVLYNSPTCPQKRHMRRRKIRGELWRSKIREIRVMKRRQSAKEKWEEWDGAGKMKKKT